MMEFLYFVHENPNLIFWTLGCYIVLALALIFFRVDIWEYQKKATTFTNADLELKRQPGRKFSRIFVLLAEGLGRKIPAAMVRELANLWEAADLPPADWLFITTGKKQRGDETVTLLSNNSLAVMEVLPRLQEATLLYRQLTAVGVPHEQVLWENLSDNTREQASFVEKLLIDVAIGFDPTHIPVTLVCHDLHGARSVKLFECAGYIVEDVVVIPYVGDWSQPLRGMGHMKLPRTVYYLAEQLQGTFRDRT